MAMKSYLCFVLLCVAMMVSCGAKEVKVTDATDAGTAVVADVHEASQATSADEAVTSVDDAGRSDSGFDDSEAASTEADESDGPSITQYMVVKVSEFGPCLRQNMGEVLKGIGFKVTEYPDPEDEMAGYLAVSASRESKSGVTTLEYRKDEYSMVTITCASQNEVDDFVTSMEKAGYVKDGAIYGHPSNEMGKIYAKVEGKTIKIIFPFEMLPSDF